MMSIMCGCKGGTELAVGDSSKRYVMQLVTFCEWLDGPTGY